MKRYLGSFAVSFSLGVASLVAVNFLVDANGVYLPQATRSALATAFVGHLTTSRDGLIFVAQERAIKLELARHSSSDCYVLGSSHEMQIDLTTAPQMLRGCRSAVNLAVSGGTFEDLVAVAGVLERRHFSGSVIVGVGPWMFRRHADARFTEIFSDYEAGLSTFGLPPDRGALTMYLSQYENLFSGDYFTHNIWAVLRGDDQFDARNASFASDNDGILLPSGSLRYSRFVLGKRSTPTPSGDGDYKIAAPVFDPEVRSAFERMLATMHQHMNVKLVLMPYHPVVMKCVSPVVCTTLHTVERYVRELGHRDGYEVIGSYDPAPFGLSWRDYLDDMHLRAESLHRVTSIDSGHLASR